jgi:TonB family protein
MLLAGLFALALLGATAVHAQKTERKLVKKVEPIYPDVLRERKIGGIVKLRVTIRPDGSVRDVHIEGGNPILAASAENAVKLWRYAPGDRDDVGEVTVHFDPDK